MQPHPGRRALDSYPLIDRTYERSYPLEVAADRTALFGARKRDAQVDHISPGSFGDTPKKSSRSRCDNVFRDVLRHACVPAGRDCPVKVKRMQGGWRTLAGTVCAQIAAGHHVAANPRHHVGACRSVQTTRAIVVINSSCTASS
jgi:hypothetical protein